MQCEHCHEAAGVRYFIDWAPQGQTARPSVPVIWLVCEACADRMKKETTTNPMQVWVDIRKVDEITTLQAQAEGREKLEGQLLWKFCIPSTLASRVPDDATVRRIYVSTDSGIRLSTHPRHDGTWVQAGFAYVEHKQAAKYYHSARFTEEIERCANVQLLDDIEAYEAFLNGESYSVAAYDTDGNPVESLPHSHVWGYRMALREAAFIRRIARERGYSLDNDHQP